MPLLFLCITIINFSFLLKKIKKIYFQFLIFCNLLLKKSLNNLFIRFSTFCIFILFSLHFTHRLFCFHHCRFLFYLKRCFFKFYNNIISSSFSFKTHANFLCASVLSQLFVPDKLYVGFRKLCDRPTQR